MYEQGDRERDIGIPVSAGMDRYTSRLPTGQLGFIQYVVKRLYQLWAELVDVGEVVVDNMLANEQYWTEEKKKMSSRKLAPQKRKSGSSTLSSKRPSESANPSNLKVITETPE